MDSQDRERRLLLKGFLQGNPKVWECLREEFRLCLSNSESSLKARGCEHRDFFAGKCEGIEECMDIDTEILKVKEKTKEDSDALATR